MMGGSGNDTYVIDEIGDTVTESANEGTDTVKSAISYALAANVENLTLTGTAAINATGNAQNNVLTGNSGANVLAGGAGNDTYVIGDGDTVIEAPGAGTDTVKSSVSTSLGANVENVTLTGSAAVNATGNMLNNVLIGHSAANILAGGEGNDTLKGGAGNDTYRFERGDGLDKVLDNDGAAGNADTVLFGSDINPLDLVISRNANDLRLTVAGSRDQLTIQDWYTNSSYHTETIQAGNGQQLVDTQVQQLIQAMATFSAQSGLTWEQAVAQRPEDVQMILAASWE